MSMFVGIARVTPAVVAILALAGSARTAQVGSAQQGHRLARSICSECHLVVKEAGRSNDPAAPTFEAIANTPGLTAATLASALQTSHKTMPNIVLRDDDLSDIIARILSLRD